MVEVLCGLWYPVHPTLSGTFTNFVTNGKRIGIPLGVATQFFLE